MKESPETDKLSKRLGNSVLIFSPSDLDELCNVVELCHKYRHKVLCGTFGIQQKNKFT